jgi:hypothetical protein
MTLRRTVLNVEELGTRVLPSATTTVLAPTAAAAQVSTTTQPTTTGSAWTGQGRFTISLNRSTGAKTYSWDGSASVGSTFFAITGTATTVGNKAGQATGKLVLSSTKGTLTVTVTGSTQAANSGLPSSMTYTVVSGTGAFSKYAGKGTLKLGVTLQPAFDDRGHFTVTATAPVGTVPTTPPPVQTTLGPSWTGQGRYTLATKANNVKAYTLQGSADFGKTGFFAIGGTIQTIGNVASGRAAGQITLSSPRGKLVLQVTGPTQSRNAGLPTTFTYRVVSGTGFFAHYVGQGTIQISATLFAGYTDKGHFNVAVKPTSK